MKKIPKNFLCSLFRKCILKPIAVSNIAQTAAGHRPDIGIYELPLGSSGMRGEIKADNNSDYFYSSCQFQSSNIYRIFYDLHSPGHFEIK